MSPGPVDACPPNPQTLNFFPWGDTAHLHMTPVQFFDPVLQSWTIFVWGENSQLHKWQVSNPAILVCTIPYGDANAQVVNGRLLVYDPVHLAADGSLKVPWDWQSFAAQFPFNKFNPPVIDGGQIQVPNYNGGVDLYRLVQ